MNGQNDQAFWKGMQVLFALLLALSLVRLAIHVYQWNQLDGYDVILVPKEGAR